MQCYNFFSEVPRVVVPDNLKSAIISNNKKGIVVNESYADLNRHYSVIVEPARPRRPKDKSKAEQGVQGIQRYILEELDKPYLNPLPTNSYVYKQFKIAKVNQDYHITLEKCSYSVPFKYIKEEVEVRYSTQSVYIYHEHKLIAIHPRLRCVGESSTLHEHMPRDHQYINEKMNPQRLRSWAKNIGEFSSVFVENAFAEVEHNPQAYRKISAVLCLAKLYGNTGLEPPRREAPDPKSIF